MAGIKMAIEMSGLIELRQKLAENVLLAGPWKNAMTRMGEIGLDAGRAAAPIGLTGKTVNMMSFRVQAKPIPLYTVVHTTATNKGYPYPRILEFSPYAQSRYRKGTNRHLHWMENAIHRAQSAFESVLEQAANEILAIWNS